MRLELTVHKFDPSSDGGGAWIEKEAIFTSKKATAVTKANYKKIVDDQLNEMMAKVENFETADGASFDSAWRIKSYDNLYINIYNIRKIRGASYIPTPEKYSNPKCGLINIQNDDQECFRWCMLYHQSKKQKNDHRVTVLKKISDKYDYKDIDFPTDTDDLYRFEKINEVSIFVYCLSNEKGFKLHKPGDPNFIQKDIVYLLLIEDEERSHYIYIKHIDHLFNLHKCSDDKDK